MDDYLNHVINKVKEVLTSYNLNLDYKIEYNYFVIPSKRELSLEIYTKIKELFVGELNNWFIFWDVASKRYAFINPRVTEDAKQYMRALNLKELIEE